jgi:hypothetical protein
MKTLLFSLIAIHAFSLNSNGEAILPLLAQHLKRFERGQMETIDHWPKHLFSGDRKIIPNKISSMEEHIASLKLIPAELLKGFTIGITVENDGWYSTSIEPKDSTEVYPTWIRVIASKKGESYLYFNSAGQQEDTIKKQNKAEMATPRKPSD